MNKKHEAGEKENHGSEFEGKNVMPLLSARIMFNKKF